MQTKTIEIAPLEIFKIKSAANSTGKYWFVASSLQDVFGGNVAAASETLLGPYAGKATVRLEIDAGEITLERVGVTSPVPTLLSEYLSNDDDGNDDFVTHDELDSRFSSIQRDAVDALTETSTLEDVIAALQAQ